MADAMVTARMPQDKKDQGNKVLSKLGLSASGAINRMYDYLIKNKSLPFLEEEKTQKLSREELQAAWEFVLSVPLEEGNRFATMSDDDIRTERLTAKGHMDGGIR